MKINVPEFGLIIALIMILAGFIVTQGDFPNQIGLSEAGVNLVLGKYRLIHTFPGISIMCCGTIIAAFSLIQLRR